MSHSRIVIVGAGLAGLRTAEGLRRAGHEGPMTLIGSEPHLPYDRPPLSKSLLASTEEPAVPLLRAADQYRDLDLELRLGRPARRLDLVAQTVTVGDDVAVAWDQLVVATGLAARSVPGWSSVAGVHTLRTVDDCRRLHRAVAGVRHVTVVGAGVLGSEIAATLRCRGMAVALVDPLSQPLQSSAGVEVGSFVADQHRRRGVDLHLGVGVAELGVEAGRVREVALSDGSAWSTDLVVTAVGGAPDTDWLADSGLELAAGPGGGVVVDTHGAASAEGVWAAGDVAAVPDPRGTGHVRLEHWTSAADLAATVAANVAATLADQPRRAHTEVPYLWTELYGVKVQCLGLIRPQDRLHVLSGSLSEGAFLAAHVDAGRVHAVSAVGAPAALMRCRRAVASRTLLEDLVVQAPWERRRPTAAAY